MNHLVYLKNNQFGTIVKATRTPWSKIEIKKIQHLYLKNVFWEDKEQVLSLILFKLL